MHLLQLIRRLLPKTSDSQRRRLSPMKTLILWCCHNNVLSSGLCRTHAEIYCYGPHEKTSARRQTAWVLELRHAFPCTPNLIHTPKSRPCPSRALNSDFLFTSNKTRSRLSPNKPSVNIGVRDYQVGKFNPRKTLIGSYVEKYWVWGLGGTTRGAVGFLNGNRFTMPY